MAAKSEESDFKGGGEEMLELCGDKMEKMNLGGDSINVKRTTTEKESLPQELIVDILSRLPAAHLWPLRCVSKPWFRLIARDPHFAKSVFDTCIQSKLVPTSIIAWGEREEDEPSSSSSSSEKKKKKKKEEKLDFYLVPDHTECDKAIKRELPFLTDQQGLSRCPVYGICNGMLCLSLSKKDEVYIWNPLTNDHITVPYTTNPLKSSDNHLITLFGFAFLQSTNEYKVIRLDGEFDWGRLKYYTKISTYTLGAIGSSWVTIADDLPYGVTFSGVPCPQINGLAHWLARKEGEMPISTVIAFDPKDELLYEIDPPINMRVYGFRSDMACVQELDGSLGFFNAINEVGVDVWTLKLDGESCTWTKHFKIGSPDIVGDFSLLIPLGVVARSGDIVLVKNTKGLITYNLNTKSVTDLKEFGFGIVNALAYFGSLISPRAIIGAGHIGA